MIEHSSNVGTLNWEGGGWRGFTSLSYMQYYKSIRTVPNDSHQFGVKISAQSVDC